MLSLSSISEICVRDFMEEDFNIRDHQLTSRERDFENALRPLSFEDFSGLD